MFAANAQSHRQTLRPKPFARLTTIAAVLVLAMGLFACGGSDSTSTPTSTTPITTYNYKEVFTDSIRELTPNVGTSAVTDWDGWSACHPDDIHRYSILNKLFNIDNGVESIFGPVASVENILDILENYEELSENGTHEIGDGGVTYTAVVSDYSGDFTVPYFEDTQTGLSKQVVITSSDDSFSTMVAYDMEGDDKALVAHTKHVFEHNSYELFRANFNETTQVLQVWVAYADDDPDTFKIQFIWKGNVEEGTFVLTQSTNAAKEDLDHDGIYEVDGMWTVMGGGNMDSEMAFRAITNDSPTDDYFVVVTMDDILSATAPAGYPAESTAIDSTTDAVQGYIDTNHESCLGWLTGYPDIDDLAWDY